MRYDRRKSRAGWEELIVLSGVGDGDVFMYIQWHLWFLFRNQTHFPRMWILAILSVGCLLWLTTSEQMVHRDLVYEHVWWWITDESVWHTCEWNNFFTTHHFLILLCFLQKYALITTAVSENHNFRMTSTILCHDVVFSMTSLRH